MTFTVTSPLLRLYLSTSAPHSCPAARFFYQPGNLQSCPPAFHFLLGQLHTVAVRCASEQRAVQSPVPTPNGFLRFLATVSFPHHRQLTLNTARVGPVLDRRPKWNFSQGVWLRCVVQAEVRLSPYKMCNVDFGLGFEAGQEQENVHTGSEVHRRMFSVHLPRGKVAGA